MNPEFFVGTVIEAAAEQEFARRQEELWGYTTIDYEQQARGLHHLEPARAPQRHQRRDDRRVARRLRPGGVRRGVDGDRHRRGRAFCTGADVNKASTSDQDDWSHGIDTQGEADARLDAAVGRLGGHPSVPVDDEADRLRGERHVCWRWTGPRHDVRHRDRIEDASFFDPHVSIGVVSGREMAASPACVPLNIAMRMALMGKHDRMSAERAFDLGLVSELVAPEDLVKRAWEIAG